MFLDISIGIFTKTFCSVRKLDLRKNKVQELQYALSSSLNLCILEKERSTFLFFLSPKDHWTLKTGYFEDPTPAIQVQTLPLEGPRSLGR